MINVALPSIMRSFGSPLAVTEWVVLIYLLTITVTLLFWGWVGDQLGKGTIYFLGLVVFAAGSLSCYWAGSLGQLILFRFFQGLGASMMMATGPAIIKNIFPKGQLGMALGCIGIATSLGLMTGPLLSGMVIHSYSWREIFLVTVPMTLLALGPAWFLLRPSLSLPDPGYEVGPLDWPGMILWAILIGLLVLGGSLPLSYSPAGLLIGGVCLLTLFLLLIELEGRREFPLLPLSLFRNRSYAIAMLCAALSFAVLFVVLLLIPFYLDYILGISPKGIGVVMMAVPLAVFLVSPLSGIFYDKIGARLLTTLGLSIAALAIFLLCFLSAESSAFSVAWRLAVLGCGQALFLSPNSATVLAQVPANRLGVSSGMLATSRNLGMLAGVSLAGLLFGVVFSGEGSAFGQNQYQPQQVDEFMYALRMTFRVTALLACLGALLSSLRVKETVC